MKTSVIKKGGYMGKAIAILILSMMPLLQGCAVGILAAGVGYAIGQGRKGTAEVMEAKSKYVEKYQNYRIELEKINLEREKSGLKPTNIPTFEQWLETQPLSPSEIKLFKKYGIISSKDMKGKKSKNKPEPETNIIPESTKDGTEQK